MPEGPQGKIFINYRRGDDPGFTTALYMRLEEEFGADRLFMDVEGHIKPGDDFVEVLGAQVAQCDVLLTIIGPRWADLLSARAGDKDDFVAIEIKAALDQGKRVIPVLVGGAGFPRAEILPEAIRALAHKHAIGLRPDRFRSDCQGLTHALKEAFVAAEAERAARTEAERRAAEAARTKREAEEAARAAELERAAKARAQAGLSPDEIRKAEELANWDFIKDSANPDEFRDHLARFHDGATERYARKKLEGLLWALPATRSSIESLRKFIEEFPKGDHAGEAQAALSALEAAAEAAREAEQRKRAETEAWAKVAASTLIADFEAFLKQWPDGAHAKDAGARVKQLRGGRFTRRAVLKGFRIGAGVIVTAIVVVTAIDSIEEAQKAARYERFKNFVQSKIGRIPRECTAGDEYSKYTQFYEKNWIQTSKESGEKPADCIEKYGIKDFE